MKLINKEILRYIIFGILTTLINTVSYVYLVNIGMDYRLSNTSAFIISVIFAFITNKIYVFESKKWHFRIVAKELMKFGVARGSTFILDMALMIVLVEFFTMNDVIAKCVVNIIVIILNYILSKWMVFK